MTEPKLSVGKTYHLIARFIAAAMGEGKRNGTDHIQKYAEDQAIEVMKYLFGIDPTETNEWNSS